MLFFEADDAREMYVAPGVLPRWLRGDGGHPVTVTDAATTNGTSFGYRMDHDEADRTLRIDITQPVPGVTYVYPCRLGTVTGAVADGGDVRLPAGTRHAEITYRLP